MTLRLLIVAILISPTQLFAQQRPAVPRETAALAAQDLENVIIETEKLDSKNAFVNIRSRAAMLISFSDPVRAETMFVAVWKFTNEQTDKDFDKEKARLVILKYLFFRNPKLARRLLSEQRKPEDQSSPSRKAARDDDLALSAKLASQLVDTDPAAAAGLLERSLSAAVTPIGLGALAHLRETQPFLSDYIVAKVLDGLTTHPTLVSLPSLHLLTSYMFPGQAAAISSPEALASLEALQFKYFLVGYDVLKASLAETNAWLLKEQNYTPRDLQYRAANQGQIAAILAALAPRLQPSWAVELTRIAGRLAPQVPANISQLTQLALKRLSGDQLTSDDPEQRFAFALSNGDFDEARKQLDRFKDGEKKNIYTQLLIRNEARALLTKPDLMGALTAIRKLEDQTTRLVMYLQALKAVKKQRDSGLTNIVINEARLLIPQTGRNGLHVRALLAFTVQLMELGAHEDAMEFFNNAITAVNALSTTDREKSEAQNMAETAMAELNDPMSLFDEPELERAFSAVGLVDLDRALDQAKKIELRPIQLLARIEAVQEVIKRGSRQPRGSTKGAKILTSPKN